MSRRTAPPAIIADDRAPPPGWDARSVGPPGGHVMQSATWGTYRARHGYEPRYLGFEDGRGVLVLLRRTPGLPGVEAIVRRGPAHAGDDPERSAARAVALAGWAREAGARDLFLDPERPADATYARAMDAAGFEVVDGPEPSIHVMRRELPAEADEDALFASLSKSTRQRVRSAERAGVQVRVDHQGERLDEFAALLQERAEVVGMRLQQGTGYLEGWRALMSADLARLLVAEHEDAIVGGLFLFRQGGIHATAFSADDALRRGELPGAMHLLRWSAMRDALDEGCAAIELGGVDLPGHRGPPGPGELNRGLYEHKRGFGAEWVEREPPRRVVLRPAAERLAWARRRVIDVVRGVRR